MSRRFRLIAVLLPALVVTLWRPALAGPSDALDQPNARANRDSSCRSACGVHNGMKR
jgi:hypothetical protein